MKKHVVNKLMMLIFPIFLVFIGSKACAQEDSVEAEQVVKLKYFNENNNIQYLILESLLKKGKQIDPQANLSFSIYMDSVAAENLVANVVTDKMGKAKTFIPVSLKSLWDARSQHNFIAQEKGKEELIELPIIKSRVTIDTSSSEGVRSISVLVEKFENDQWVPLNEAEMKIGFRRLGSILPAGDEPTYTTDSTGAITVEVTRDSLPGDVKGYLMIAVKIEDNEFVGNVVTEKQTPWGVPLNINNDFFEKRTLWSTGLQTPVWLLLIAGTIVFSVWGTLIYLVFQLIKIKKLGRQASLKDTIA